MDLATTARTVRELEFEIETLKRLEKMAARVRSGASDRKWEQLSDLLEKEGLMRDESEVPRS